MASRHRANEVWDSERRLAEQVIGSNERRDVLDVDECLRKKSCLGRAVAVESDAVQLIWVGFDVEARRYLVALKALAMAAYESNDGYIYNDPDGKNLFGQYTALRIAAFSQWCVNEDRTAYMEAALEKFRQMLESVQNEVARPESAVSLQALNARYVLHLAQLGRWSDILAIERPSLEGLWSEIQVLCRMLAVDAIAGDSKRGKEVIDSWFRSQIDVEKFGRPHNPKFAAAEIVAIAEVRARWIYGIDEPFAIIKSVRSPDNREGSMESDAFLN